MSAVDNDEGDFHYDLIEMTLVDVFIFKHLQNKIGRLAKQKIEGK